METNTYNKIIDLLYTSVISEGGDGDASWLSKYKPLNEIRVLLEDYNSVNNTGWVLEDYGHYLLWGRDQEYVTVTCDKDFFNLDPHYITMRLIF